MNPYRKHPLAFAEWSAVATSGDSPDPLVGIAKVTELPPGALLTLEYQSDQPVAAALDGSMAVDTDPDFYSGEPPELRRVIVVADGSGSRVHLELAPGSPSVFYRGETKTLYARHSIASEPETPADSAE